MIDYEEDWLVLLLFYKDGTVAVRSSLFAVPAAIFAVVLLYCDEWYPGRREDLGMFELNGSQIWNAATGVLALLLGFRTGQGFARFWEGTGLLHQMRGEWFDTVSNCVTFSISAKEKKRTAVNTFRHTLVRLMSLCHGSALEEIASNQIKIESIDVFGLDDGTLNHLKDCSENYGFNKVEVMLHLVQSLITKALDDGLMIIPPPIASRVYQTISRGFVNLLNAKKITDTRFPFPYAQLISLLLLLHTALTPMIMASLIKSKVLCAIFTFIPVFGMFSLNFIAMELENPFGIDDNDLPLPHFQEEMNSCLLMLLHDNTDMISTTSDDCVMDFEALLKTMTKVNRGSSFVRRESDFGLEELRELKENMEKMKKTEEPDGVAPLPPATAPPPLVVTPAPAPAPAPAQPPAPAKPKDPATNLVTNMEDFSLKLLNWTQMLDTNTKQMSQSFDALQAQNVNLQRLLKNGFGSWETAVSPVP
jgi:predicted membrane chloride channel (bestrophin family)